MIGPIGPKTLAGFAAAALLSAGGATVWFSDLMPYSASSKSPSLLSMLHSRSPGDRAAGARSNKSAPTSAVLSEHTPAAKPVKLASAVLPAALAAPVSAVPAIAGAAIPIPVAAAPVATAALVPAAAGSSLFVPPLIIPGGGGGGGIVVAVTPPGGGGNPPPVPGVPEPQTWAMMIMGFGFVGAVLRRRRRLGSSKGARPSFAVAAPAR